MQAAKDGQILAFSSREIVPDVKAKSSYLEVSLALHVGASQHIALASQRFENEDNPRTRNEVSAWKKEQYAKAFAVLTAAFQLDGDVRVSNTGKAVEITQETEIDGNSQRAKFVIPGGDIERALAALLQHEKDRDAYRDARTRTSP